MKAEITLGIKPELDALTRSINAINKSMRIDLGLNIENAISDGIKKLKIGFKNNMPVTEINELRKKIKDATKVELKLNIDQATNQLKTLGTQAIGTYGFFKGIVSNPVSINLDFNTAINEINKFSNFSTQELAVFKKDIWSLGKTNGLGMNDILKMSELSAQLGIAKTDLKAFTQNAINLKIGLGLSQEEAVNLSTSIYKAFNMGIKDIEVFSDEVTAMANSTGQSGKKILEVTKSTLAGAKAFGLSAKETSALSSAFLSVGLDSSEASSSINKFFTELNNIDNASEGFKRSLTKMGLDAQTLKEDIANNPQEAIKSLFVELNDLDDEERFGVISEIFGKKMANNINSAKDGIKAFEKALEESKDSAGALQKAVDRAAGDGFGDVVIQLSSAFKHLGVSIGNGFVPILKPIFEGIKNITNAISGFLDNHQWAGKLLAIGGGMLFLTKTIGVLGMVFQPLKFLFFYPFQIALRNIEIGLIAVGKEMKATNIISYVFGQSLNFLKISFKSAIVGIRAFSIALLTTPIGWFGLALGVVAFAIYKLWSGIGAFFSGLFSGIQAGLSPLKDSFMGLWNALKTAFAPITNLLGFVFGKLFSQMDATQEKLNGWTQFGFMIGRAIGGFLYILAKPFEWLIQIITLALDGVAKATNWIENSTLGKMIFGDENKAIDVNKTTQLKGTIDEVIAKQNENKAKMLSSISSNDNSRQINDYKTITINTNANPQAIASAINSYSYDDEF